MCLLNDSSACCFHPSLIRSDGAGDVIQRKNKQRCAQNKSSFPTNWRMAHRRQRQRQRRRCWQRILVEQRNPKIIYIFPISKLTSKELKTASKSYLDVYNENNNNNNNNFDAHRAREWIRASCLTSKMNDILRRKKRKTFWSVTSSSLVVDFFLLRFVSFPKSLTKSDDENQRMARTKASAAAFSWTLVCARTSELKWKD